MSSAETLYALYDRMADDTTAAVDGLPAGTVAERYYQIMTVKVEQLLPYRADMGDLFSEALHPQSTVSILGAGAASARERIKAAFERVVADATDVPKGAQAAQAGELAAFLYGIHLLMLLFWLYDRTPERRATRELLAITRAGLGLLRPALLLPPVAKMMTRLAASIDAVLGGGAVGGGL